MAYHNVLSLGSSGDFWTLVVDHYGLVIDGHLGWGNFLTGVYKVGKVCGCEASNTHVQAVDAGRDVLVH